MPPSFRHGSAEVKGALTVVFTPPRLGGFAGPANAKAGEVYSKYVVTDMFAKAVQGMKPEEVVKWAEGELKKVYES